MGVEWLENENTWRALTAVGVSGYSGGIVKVLSEANESLNQTLTPYVVPTLTQIANSTPQPPGWEAVIAIAGLLAVAYIVLRRKY